MNTFADLSLEPQKRTMRATLPVSFLVTSYNKSAYLPAVLDSVWRESEAVGGEVLLVDDGSADGSERICAAFAELHPQIHYWRQDNRGIYQTINMVAAKAQGRWIRFCDSDDPLISGSTLRLMEVAEETGAGIVYGRAVRYGPEPLLQQELSLRIAPISATNVHTDGVMYLIRGMNFTPSMALCRGEAIKAALPLPADLVSCQDLAWCFPIVSRMPLAWIDEPVCFNLQGAPNQLSANHALTLQQTIRITQRNAGLLSDRHKQAAILKAANRTRRWMRKMVPHRNSLGLQMWLLGISAQAKLGIIDFHTTLDKIAFYYERELEPILQKRVRPF